MLRIGTVPYLVARPLTAGLADRNDVELIEALPADLARMLRQDQVDVALAPSILSLEPDDFPFWHEGPVIASQGPVRSVLLLLRPDCEPKDVKRMALDPASRTGRALAEIILRDHFGAEPKLEECSPAIALNKENPNFDAVQIIGDPALKLAHKNPDRKLLDLGGTWQALTRLPFVYAGWIGRTGFHPSEAAHILQPAAVEGLAQRHSLAAQGAPELGLPLDYLSRYLFQDLSYTLSADLVRSALAEFQARLRLLVS